METKNDEDNGGKKIAVFERSNDKEHPVLFEFNVRTSPSPPYSSPWDKLDKAYYIPLTLGKAIRWCIENYGHEMKFNDNLKKLIVDLSTLSLYLPVLPEIKIDCFGDDHLPHDLMILRSNTVYMSVFHKSSRNS